MVKMSIDLDKWRLDECGKSLAYFSKNKQVSISRNMINELKKISEKNGKINARFCLHNNPDENLQDMVMVSYKDKTCRKLHKHIQGKESIHLIEGKALALIVNENGELIDKRILEDRMEFIYRNDNGTYHNYFPLTEYIIFREIRDIKNEPGETVFPPWDSVKILKKYLPYEYLKCNNNFCKNPCDLFFKKL